ncbi:Streptomyces sporulation and cell division protein, SsgA [Streptomyces sp. DvalAA-14]|uniref:SsgA family sporulation/cell division regulator n=1 Tax=unclassified Streptomyces TaxID=2593676 RepID=UPI00081BACC1|nr:MULTISPECIES: SsgA family sporulation/cell division regulator [unclassified Streptomyces]MYS22091.1 SsgA family sporulation/cell division regulator [Streptomyces sp. SID4948]SCE08452.1 Streptomyces sporulation and cell division protein, SsgA [Streptomyces sp. DvalAA-14]
MQTVVERELEMQLVLSPERSIPVPVRLAYRTVDPYAVHIVFHVGSDTPVNWTFARELLVEGVFRPCGNGDVRIWPTKVNGRSVICIALSSPDGDALLEAPSSPVSAWLERALRVVPPGTEHEQLSMDDGLSRLLAPAAGDEAWLRDPCAGQDDTPDASA